MKEGLTLQGEWRVNHEHQGIEVSFPGKPPQSTIDQLKKNGFRWSGFSKVWYAKDYPYRREFLNTIATRGEDVEASGKSFAEKMEEKQERAEARRERFEGYAEGAQREADRRFTTAHTMAQAIPFGQPILVGHHSERRDRNYRERIGNNMDKGLEAQRKAEHLSGRAASAGTNLEGYDRPDFLQRRIRECEAELRVIERNRARWQARKPLRDAYLAWRDAGNSQRTDPGFNWEWGYLLDNNYQGDAEDPWKTSTTEIQSKLDFCRHRLEELGGNKYGPHNINKGDFLSARHGLSVVLRVNPTCVTVNFLHAALRSCNPGKVEYGRIKDAKSPAEMREIVQKQLADNPAVDLAPELAALVVAPAESPKSGLSSSSPVTQSAPEPAQAPPAVKVVATPPKRQSTADKVREALKAEFPGVKFSVRTSRGGSVNVNWTDGPAYERVEPIAKQFAHVRYDEYSGEILGGGNTFVFCERSASPALAGKALTEAHERYGVPLVDKPEHLPYIDSRYYHQILNQMEG